jgi:hypothetical protein
MKVKHSDKGKIQHSITKFFPNKKELKPNNKRKNNLVLQIFLLIRRI